MSVDNCWPHGEILEARSMSNCVAQISREVEIHKSMHHKNIVGFHGYFEDSDNVYIVLENCTNKVSVARRCQ